MGRVLLALSFWIATAACAEPAVLVADLRVGGYVLYLRHASTDFSQNDASMKSYEDCAGQRNLTDKGRGEARAIGEHVKDRRPDPPRGLAGPAVDAYGERATRKPTITSRTKLR